MNQTVIQANIELHTALAATYNETEPHFRPENRQRVRGRLEDIKQRTDGGRLLDLGCGTGFILSLAADLFQEVHGVDITPAMLERVDRSPGNVTLTIGRAESTPYPDAHFDMVTAYSFLHHTADYRLVLQEAYRVLKPGGVCFTSQDPNRLYWQGLAALDSSSHSIAPSVLQARRAALDVDQVLQEQFGTPVSLSKAAEPIRSGRGGLDPAEVASDVLACGFRSCDLRLEWFLGQAALLHSGSAGATSTVETYLRSVTPLSNHLFKYIEVVMQK